ncbi:DUF2264 domain-containing protein [Lachnotalea sp. AF33-28]|uniref:DUF2264 domain-containing protein n=1 Tax=Lachnotalea sp. AF33-28 TaxID=2292046 RepID=UPI001FAB01B9|nr:DUF2264 domain-containing protein [Lachnotalea sp. AF33-28]
MKISMEELKTKQDYQRLLFSLLDPLKPFYSEGRAQLNIGHTSAAYENATIPMEAFARPLWGLVPFWAGGGENAKFEEIYRSGLIHGTDESDPEYWGKWRDYDQKFVEMAAIAYGMLMVPEKLWDPLTEKEKENLVNWLSGINQYECNISNWQYFCILVNVALKVRGCAYSEERMQRGLSRIESMYQDDGWYTDKVGGHKDYYIGFAIHFYSLIYAMFMEEYDPKRCRIFRERAKAFGKEFVYWFAKDGSALPYGRSQTYRFAQVSFFSVCAMAKIDIFSVDVLKGIITRNLVQWLNRPIFDNAGILTIGYGYPNLQMSEDYNAPGSPYWGMKAFAFLALPDEDEFWRVNAAPLPELEQLKTICCGDMVIQRDGDGQVTALIPGRSFVSGSNHVAEKYGKFAYSTRFGFSIARALTSMREAAPDSMLAFEAAGHVFVKEKIQNYEIKDSQIRIEWSPIPGIQVITWLIPTDTGHVRRHRIISGYACTAYDCGFAVSVDDRRYSDRGENGQEAYVKNEDGSCRVLSLLGEGSGQVLITAPNTNVLASKTAIPMIRYEIAPGTSEISTEVFYRTM